MSLLIKENLLLLALLPSSVVCKTKDVVICVYKLFKILATEVLLFLYNVNLVLYDGGVYNSAYS